MHRNLSLPIQPTLFTLRFWVISRTRTQEQWCPRPAGNKNKMPADLPIHKFSGKGQLSDVKEELDSGVDPNLPGAQQRAPLHKAVGGGHSDIVKLLIERGANVECKDKSQKTPLHWCALVDSVDCAKILVGDGKGDVNAKTKAGATPCHLAADEDKLAILTWLVENGADGDALNLFGIARSIAKAQKN